MRIRFVAIDFNTFTIRRNVGRPSDVVLGVMAGAMVVVVVVGTVGTVAIGDMVVVVVVA